MMKKDKRNSEKCKYNTGKTKMSKTQKKKRREKSRRFKQITPDRQRQKSMKGGDYQTHAHTSSCEVIHSSGRYTEAVGQKPKASVLSPAKRLISHPR